jgi:tRNA-dihydrouridine synthase
MFARGAQGNPFIFRLTKDLLENRKSTTPTFEERIAVAFRHLELLAADIGERTACREMRKAFCAYTKGPPGEKGEPGSAALRDRLVHAETIEDYKTIFSI